MSSTRLELSEELRNLPESRRRGKVRDGWMGGRGREVEKAVATADRSHASDYAELQLKPRGSPIK